MKIVKPPLMFVVVFGILLVLVGGLYWKHHRDAGRLRESGAAGDGSASDVSEARKLDFVLSEAGLSVDQPYQVIDSVASSRALLGGHLDHHCLALSKIETETWAQYSILPASAKIAVNEALSAGMAKTCFAAPPLDPAKLKANILKAEFDDGKLTEYVVVVFDARNKRLLYVNAKP